ncbi:hypothetical protein JMJ35_004826 [Cladonia borealis]|uniref:Uncharacterized protein n=1 Tax=Cladonia borealis TaxID=184061 RepID=A0AA39R383_9LECA|nr:hypothetical protein JMJ35_004826 [Cladonia borealis]
MQDIPPVGPHALELSPGVTQGEHKSLSTEVFAPPSRMWVWALEFATLVHQDARGILATDYSTHRIPPELNVYKSPHFLKTTCDLPPYLAMPRTHEVPTRVLTLLNSPTGPANIARPLKDPRKVQQSAAQSPRLPRTFTQRLTTKPANALAKLFAGCLQILTPASSQAHPMPDPFRSGQCNSHS